MCRGRQADNEEELCWRKCRSIVLTSSYRVGGARQAGGGPLEKALLAWLVLLVLLTFDLMCLELRS